jgi:hypothetical protein
MSHLTAENIQIDIELFCKKISQDEERVINKTQATMPALPTKW